MSVTTFLQKGYQRMRTAFFRFFRLQSGPHIKVYNGYGNEDKCLVYGHSFLLSPLGRKKYRQGFVRNTLALIRLFLVKPLSKANIILELDDQKLEVVSARDGFFKFEWESASKMLPGSHHFPVILLNKKGKAIYHSEATIIISTPASYSCISDIDDTFLISHSGNLRKRLYVLFTENAHSRRPFEGVVNHYRLLSGLEKTGSYNTFFYVSSSEWNLYQYISEFIQQQELPQGVLLLNQLKTFSGLLKTGQGNHQGKYFRIVRILEMFPHQKFILLGDDTQKDPDIYNAVTKSFPQNFLCVYIRRIGKSGKEHVLNVKDEIEARGIPFIYFAHSEEALQHSREMGLIK